jgi:hypothetical protein
LARASRAVDRTQVPTRFRALAPIASVPSAIGTRVVVQIRTCDVKTDV